MKPPDALGLVVRCLGLPLSLYGAHHVYRIILRLVGSPIDWASFFIFGVPSLVVGVWFLRGAPRLISFCYRSGEQEEWDQ